MQKVQKIHVKEKVILTYIVAIAIACIVFYFIIPSLLNYGEGTINTEFDKEISGGLYYYQQILLAASALILIVSIILLVFLRDLNKYRTYLKEFKKTRNKEIGMKIERIKKICLGLPSKLLLVFIIVPLVCSLLVLFMQTSYLTSSDFKLVLVIFILSTITISIANTYVRKVFTKVLIELENTSDCNIRHLGITERLLTQIIPIIAVCIVFTYLTVSSIYEKNNSELLRNYYNTQFRNDTRSKIINNETELIDLLNSVNLYADNHILFIVDNNFNFTYQTGPLSDFFKKYTAEIATSNNNHIYDYYGTAGQGTMYPVLVGNETYYIGAYYLISENDSLFNIIVVLVSLTSLCTLIIYAFAKELSDNIKAVSHSLQEISETSDSVVNSKLYITSLDEISDLKEQYNHIQKTTADLLDQIHNNQQILMERERLASLGQLIGGIAHNLKTPIMSISGATEGLNDLINEYDSSIEDPTVNYEDHHQIAKEMKDWTEKIKTHTAYMSDIITTVKGQAVVLSEDENNSFTIDELIKKVTILMRHELKNALVYLKTDIRVPLDFTLKGNVNILVQVINNMISNAIQAYNGKPDMEILLSINQNNNYLYINIIDNAGGLPNKVKEKLFKEMITTKGKNGTGLGLFMSYSSIRAHFDGDINFESEEGKGTTFTISIPLN